MQIVIEYDSSVSSAPAGYKTAVEAAVTYLDQLITNPISVAIVFSYGEIDGSKMGKGDLGESLTNGDFESYATTVGLLTGAAMSSDALQSVHALPAADPTHGGTFWVSDAEAAAFGLGSEPGFTDPEDGFVGLGKESSSLTFSFDPSDRAVPGEYDAIGTLEHEITEALGRIDYLGSPQGQYAPMDLFRYSAPGQAVLTNSPGYFSINGGQTSVAAYNNPSNGGDAGDWANSVIDDSFDAFSNSGVENGISRADKIEMNALGFQINWQTAPNDFTGGGDSGVLFSGSGGALATWEMNGVAIDGGGDIGAPGGTWSAVQTGDFNTDGMSDILFHDASGNLAIWEMNGAAIVGGGALGNPGGTWSPVGTGDFNGDGASDILFQDAAHNLSIWEMNGTAIIGGGNIGSPGGSWTEAAVGDFTGEGNSDILFQDASGNLAIWEMNGTAIVGGGDIGNPGAGWSVKGVGDFNADGTSDILFENTSGEYAIWEMNGTSIIGGGDIGNPGGTWQFAAVGDYNGDGHADILFEDAAGNLAIWEMNGASIIGGGDIGNPGSTWHVLG
jgi:hypothetical protein